MEGGQKEESVVHFSLLLLWVGCFSGCVRLSTKHSLPSKGASDARMSWFRCRRVLSATEYQTTATCVVSACALNCCWHNIREACKSGWKLGMIVDNSPYRKNKGKHKNKIEEIIYWYQEGKITGTATNNGIYFVYSSIVSGEASAR